MIARVFAWVVVAMVLYGIVHYGRQTKNPFKPGETLVPVAAQLPKLPAGCAGKEAGCL